MSYDYDAHGNLAASFIFRDAYTQVTSTSFFDLSTDRISGSSVDPTQSDNTKPEMYSYDATGRLSARAGPPTPAIATGESTQFAYTSGIEPAVDGSGTRIGGVLTPPGLLKSVTTAAGSTTYAYDQRGDLTVEIPLGSPRILRTYDATGLQVSENDPESADSSGATVRLTRDIVGRITTETYPCVANAVTEAVSRKLVQREYDRDGLPTVITERAVSCDDGADLAPPRITSFRYNPQGRVSSVIDAVGGRTSYDYSSVIPEQIVSQTDTRGRVTRYSYNFMGKVASVSGDEGSPGSTHVVVTNTYGYDSAQRLLLESDAIGRRTNYQLTGDGFVVDATRVASPGRAGTTTVLWSRSYDALGNITSETQGGIRTTNNVYDSEGRLQSTAVDPGGVNRVTTITRDTAGRLISSMLTGGGESRSVSTTVNAVGQELSVTIGGNTTAISRSSTGLVTGVTDPRGTVPGGSVADFTTNTQYDVLDRPVKRIRPPVLVDAPVDLDDFSGLTQTSVRPTETIGYDAFGSITEVKDANGNVTSYVYDAAGRKTEEHLPSYTRPGSSTVIHAVKKWTYSSAGDLVSAVDAHANETRYDYDIAGNLTKETAPGINGEKPAKSYTYDNVGQMTRQVSATGAQTDYAYDNVGNRVAKTDRKRLEDANSSLSYTTVYTYNGLGDLLKVTTPAGRITSYTYDNVGEVTSISYSGRDRADTYIYNLAGQIRSHSGANYVRTDYTYEATGELSNTLINGALSSIQYHDRAGNVVMKTHPGSGATSYFFDAENRVTRTTKTVGGSNLITTLAGYDAVGNQVSATDGDGHATWTTYTSMNLPERVVKPATAVHSSLSDRSWVTSYDAAALPIEQRAPGGVVVTNSFDPRDNLLSQAGHGPPDGPVSAVSNTFSYDADDRLASETYPGGNQTFSWNDLGEVVSSDGPGGESAFGYDGDGHLTKRVTGTGASDFTYNLWGALASATDTATGTATSWSYDPSSGTLLSKEAQGISTGWLHDLRGRVSAKTLSTTVGTQGIEVTEYGYDLADRVISRTENGGVEGSAKYGYDGADRLVSWTPQPDESGLSDPAVSYTYDNANNRTAAISADGSSTTWSYDERNELTSVETTATDSTVVTQPVSEDASGAVAKIGTGSSARTFAFDALGRLAVDGDARYEYDGLGRLATRAKGSEQPTKFSYAGFEQEPYSSPDIAAGTETATRDPFGELLATSSNSVNRSIYTNVHGDVVGATSAADGDALIGAMGYDPYGQILPGSAILGGPEMANKASVYGFQGNWTDPSTGAVNMHARWYDPGIGRFLSSDPVSTPLQGSSGNAYAYANDSPIGNNDPTGLTSATLVGPGIGDLLPGWMEEVLAGLNADLAASAAGWGSEAAAGAAAETAVGAVGFGLADLIPVVGVVAVFAGLAYYWTSAQTGPQVQSLYDPDTGLPLHSASSAPPRPALSEPAPSRVTSTGVRTTYSSAWASAQSDVLSAGFRIQTTTWMQSQFQQGFRDWSAGSRTWDPIRYIRDVVAGVQTDLQRVVDPTRVTNSITTTLSAMSGQVSETQVGELEDGSASCGLNGSLVSCVTGDRPLAGGCAAPDAPSRLCIAATPVPGKPGGVRGAASAAPVSNPDGMLIPNSPSTATGSAGSGGGGGIKIPAEPSKCGDPSEDGIVYLRTDANGGVKPYVGQTMSNARYIARQIEHSRNFPLADFGFKILDRAQPGLPLDHLEQYYIQQYGGPTNEGNPDGLLSNRRNQMNQDRYFDAGGDC